MKNEMAQIGFSKTLKVVVLLSMCVLYVLILVYFDEGRNSLKGIFDKTNLPAIGIYFITMIGFVILMYQILKNFLKENIAGILSILVGPVVGISVIIGFLILVSKVF